MLHAAAVALAESLTEEDIKEERLFPTVDRIRSVCNHVALGVARQAYTDGTGTVHWDGTDQHLAHLVSRHQWEPSYGSYVPFRQ